MLLLVHSMPKNRPGRHKLSDRRVHRTLFSCCVVNFLPNAINTDENPQPVADQIVAERLKAMPTLAKGKPQGRVGPFDATKARLIAEAAKEVSQPDSVRRDRGPRPVSDPVTRPEQDRQAAYHACGATGEQATDKAARM